MSTCSSHTLFVSLPSVCTYVCAIKTPPERSLFIIMKDPGYLKGYEISFIQCIYVSAFVILVHAVSSPIFCGQGIKVPWQNAKELIWQEMTLATSMRRSLCLRGFLKLFSSSHVQVRKHVPVHMSLCKLRQPSHVPGSWIGIRSSSQSFSLDTGAPKAVSTSALSIGEQQVKTDTLMLSPKHKWFSGTMYYINRKCYCILPVVNLDCRKS